MFRLARIQAYTLKNILSAFEATGIVPFNPRRILNRYTGTAAADPKQKKSTLTSTLSPIPSTPSNTRAVRHMRQAAFAEFDIADNPKLGTFIDKLVNAAVGGLTEGFLGHDRAIQLEATLNQRVDDLKNARRRTKVTTARAITGSELLQKMKDLALNPSKTPKKAPGTTKKVTFSKPPKLQKRRAPSPATIELSSTSSESGEGSGFESDSDGSTIYVMTPGTIQATPGQCAISTPTPAARKLAASGPATQGSHTRALRPRR